MSLKIPAIRSKMGIWFYYVSSLSFKEVSRYVRPIDDELHHSDLLSGMIQRSITSNYKSIANYLETQSERFFNSFKEASAVCEKFRDSVTSCKYMYEVISR